MKLKNMVWGNSFKMNFNSFLIEGLSKYVIVTILYISIVCVFTISFLVNTKMDINSFLLVQKKAYFEKIKPRGTGSDLEWHKIWLWYF